MQLLPVCSRTMRPAVTPVFRHGIYEIHRWFGLFPALAGFRCGSFDSCVSLADGNYMRLSPFPQQTMVELSQFSRGHTLLGTNIQACGEMLCPTGQITSGRSLGGVKVRVRSGTK